MKSALPNLEPYVIDKIEKEHVGDVKADTMYANEYISDSMEEFDLGDTLGTAIIDKDYDLEEIVDYRQFKEALLKSLELLYNYKKDRYSSSFKYIQIFILMNGITLPEKYSYLLEDKYNIPSNYELSIVEYAKLFNITKQAVSSSIISITDFIFKLSKACYSRTKANIRENLYDILVDLPIKDNILNELIEGLSDEELEFLCYDYITYISEEKGTYETYCTKFNESILDRYIQLLDEKTLLYLVVNEQEDYIKKRVYKTIFDRPIFQKVYDTFNDRDKITIKRYFMGSYKDRGSNVEQTIHIFLSVYKKNINRYKRCPSRKIKSNREVNITSIEASPDIKNEIDRIKSAANSVKKYVKPEIKEVMPNRNEIKDYYSVFISRYINLTSDESLSKDGFNLAFSYSLLFYINYLFNTKNYLYLSLIMDNIYIPDDVKYDISKKYIPYDHNRLKYTILDIEKILLELTFAFSNSKKDAGNYDRIFGDFTIKEEGLPFNEAIIEYLNSDFKFFISKYKELKIICEDMNKSILKKYIGSLSEKELYDIQLAYMKDNPEFFNFEFTSRYKIILAHVFMTPTFQKLYENLSEPNKSIIRFIYTGVGNDITKKYTLKKSLDKYKLAFISIWNVYNGYFNERYIEKHNMKK